ncbi:MAG: hydroxymethylbilane synthase [Candidatus Nanopelagicales bacterium]
MTALRLATRRSPLATAQSRLVAEAITEATGRPVELVGVESEGDRNRAPLTEIGGVGVFVAAVRQAVLDGRADLAVHSLKDLPTADAPGLRLAAVPARADVRDALVGATLAELPVGARVGTGSPRRAAQLTTLRPDLEIIDIRGNVDTRIALTDSGDVAAVVLALAGLQRLDRADRVAQVLPVTQMLPAPGQAALAIETRADDGGSAAAVAPLDDPVTRSAVACERALLRALEAGCTAPVGALATVVDDQILLDAAVWGGGAEIRGSHSGPRDTADAIGRRAAAALLADGADRLVGGTIR